MKHEVMGAPHWGPVIAQRQRASVLETGLGFAVLRLLHSNGYGVPVETAFDFAAWLQRRDADGHFWGNAFQQLFAGMDLRGMHSSVSLLERRMRENPFQAVRLLLLPAAGRVMGRIQKNILFSTTDRCGPHSKGDYQKYAEEFQAELAKILPENSLDPLTKANDESTKAWRRALALRLVQYAHLPEIPEDPDGRSLPDIFAAELFLAATRQQFSSGPDKAVPQLAQEGTVRRSSRQQQDGITGIRHASPGEDPSSMLQHQMVNAFDVLVEQIENEGFIAYDRPPPLPEKRRFVFAALGADIADSRGLSLLRAAWWLACSRMEIMLCEQDAGLDFAWLQSANGVAGRGGFVRSPQKFARIRPDDTSAHYLARCAGLGAPFRAGRTKVPGAMSAASPRWPASVVRLLGDEGIRVSDRKQTQVAVLMLSIQELAGRGDRHEDHLQVWREDLIVHGVEAPHILSAVIDSSEDTQSVSLDAGENILVCDDFEGCAQQTLEIANFFIDEMMKVVRNE